MADSERFRVKGEETGNPARRREELDHLLQRIAQHIAEVDKSTEAHPETSVDTEMASRSSQEPGPATLHRDADTSAEISSSAAESHAHVAERGQPESLSEMFTEKESVADRGAPEPADLSQPEFYPEGDQWPASGSRDDQGDLSHDRTGRAASHDRDDLWDHDTAEALTRSYEAEAQVPPLRSMYNLMAQQKAPTSELGLRTAARSGGATSDEFSHADVDAAQTRLFEAARRVEAMLDRLAPREAVDALGDRFDSLEVEVRRSADGLSRLDGIETRLGELTHKLTDDQVLNLFGSLVPTADELTQFAEDAAGRAATRALEAYARDAASPAVPEREPDEASAVVGSQLASLGEVLGRFMDERRRSDAGTLEALETLQLAMQHVLDRIDRAETRSEQQSAAAVEPAATHHRDVAHVAPVVAEHRSFDTQHEPHLAVDDVDADIDPPSLGVVNLTANQLGGAPDLNAESYSMPESGLQDLASPAGSDVSGPESVVVRRLDDGLPVWARRDETGDSSDLALPTPVAPVGVADAPPTSDRQAFIANARRAAERAKAQAGSPKTKTDETGPTKGGRWNMLSSEASRGIIRPGVLLVAIAAIAFAGWWLLFGQKDALLRPSASVGVEQPQAAASVVAVPPSSETTSATSTSTESDTTAPSEQHAQAPAPAAAEQADASVGPGMSVSFANSPATIDAVMKARERNRMANLSQRTAFSAGRDYTLKDADVETPPAASHRPTPRPTDTSAIETASVAHMPGAARTTGVATDARHLILPPAMSGPLSLRLAAAKGDAAAQVEIATRLAEAKGVRQDFAEAAQWYERAADQGHPIAQYRLATLYERGMGVTTDRLKAQALYQKAADQGNLKAMHNLAVITASPATGAPDYATAAGLFTRAAQHGLRDSQYNLGVLYESGLGVAKDHGAAYKWYALAARSGDTVAARRRDALIARLPAETLRAMDAQIAAWRPAPANNAVNDARAAAAAHLPNGA